MAKACGDDVAPDDQVRLAHAGHHGAHQRMHRLDRGDDTQAVVAGRRRAGGGGAADERRGGKREGDASWHDRRTAHGRTSLYSAVMPMIM